MHGKGCSCRFAVCPALQHEVIAMREATRGAGGSYIRGVTRGDIETRQLSSVRKLKSSRRYLLSEEEVFLKLWCEGFNTEGVGASATMNVLAVNVVVCTRSLSRGSKACRTNMVDCGKIAVMKKIRVTSIIRFFYRFANLCLSQPISVCL